MENQKKILTRIRLINWHYFEDETIALNGSTLISGENTAGKSTILDAIQLVLTTNTRRFNVAANEKGNRNLKGYVRCKIGNIGETYLRKNMVPANVALEFYEEKNERYFVIGVHMLSQDEESSITKKWYVEECRLEELSFITNGKPSLADEFRINGRKIRYIEQKNMAKDRFKRRLGNLDDKFFDIIPKSLAFKPMDNVKEFINKFVLSEEHIDVVSLRENIETLSELEEVLERSRKELTMLEKITEKYEAIEAKNHDIKVNELLIKIATHEALKNAIEEEEKELRLKEQTVESNSREIQEHENKIRELDQKIIEIQLAINGNEANKLVAGTKQRIQALEEKQEEEKRKQSNLKSQLESLKFYLKKLLVMEERPISAKELELLGAAVPEREKIQIVERLVSFEQHRLKEIQEEAIEHGLRMKGLGKEIESLQQRLQKLKKRNLTYPENTRLLKEAIEKEFVRRGIRSQVYILAELLEITDEKWTNAVEGYFNTQKFYLVVEPEYYDIALDIYHRNRDRIHTAGIINTKKIPLDYEMEQKSLAYVVSSENRYAKAYAYYVLGRVMRCETVQELEHYPISITTECMLYQGYVVRNLDKRTYENPFIGQNAYRVQILNVQQELGEKTSERSILRNEIKIYNDVIEAAGNVNLEMVKIFMNSPEKWNQYKEQINEAKRELKEAENNPELIELTIKLNEQNGKKDKVNDEKTKLSNSNARLEQQIEDGRGQIQKDSRQMQEYAKELEQRQDEDGISYQEAIEKYRLNRKTKTPRTIADNFGPQKEKLVKSREALLFGNDGTTGLMQLQTKFNQDFNQDFLIGMEGMADYREAMGKLKSVELVRYEEQLRKAKDNCEEIFRSDFLSKMKEHIEEAKNEFRNLNRALDNIYYGEDSYRFKIGFDKKKEGLYRMITSENNQEGFNLWTSQFETEYKEEMSELFEKLMTKDDKGQKIVEEYTDYRSYLDYDIEIHKKDGSVQRFSDIYGEKSGSETQVPYYVAIAASFYQLYRYGNSVRLMLLDEAFDKMDDERILAMMDFFNSLGLQVLLATPPAKIEVIGEKVDTVLTAIRVGQTSIVEEYEF